MTQFISVLHSSEVPENGNKAVEINGQSILICRSGDQFHAIANSCSHRQKPLEGGQVRGSFITCPVHGARFDLLTGKPQGKLTQVAIAVYPVRLVDGQVQVGGLMVDGIPLHLSETVG